MATIPKRDALSTLRGVPYDWYARLRDEPANRHPRMTYVDGTLEILSPEFRHESNAERVSMIVRAVASTFGLACLGARRTMIRRGKDTIHGDVDPPPDLWIEIDNRGSSRGRLPLYASLGVPEVWRLHARRGTAWFARLDQGSYIEILASLSLPMVTPRLLLTLLDRAHDAPEETSWDDWMRDWLRQTFRPAYDAGNEGILP